MIDPVLALSLLFSFSFICGWIGMMYENRKYKKIEAFQERQQRKFDDLNNRPTTNEN